LVVEVLVMNMSDRWSLQLSVSETDGETNAEARLVMDGDVLRTGHGRARLNPADQEVAKIGGEIAVARALSDLAHKLLHAAASDVEGMTHERAHLHL
jgi:Rv2632c-like